MTTSHQKQSFGIIIHGDWNEGHYLFSRSPGTSLMINDISNVLLFMPRVDDFLAIMFLTFKFIPFLFILAASLSFIIFPALKESNIITYTTTSIIQYSINYNTTKYSTNYVYNQTFCIYNNNENLCFRFVACYACMQRGLVIFISLFLF